MNTYGGGTVVNEGSLIDMNPHGGYVTNADLEFQVANDQTYTGGITGTGSFTKSGAGSLVAWNSNDYAGATTIREGTLIGLSDNTLPTTTDLTIYKEGEYLLAADLSQTVKSLSGTGAVVLGEHSSLTVDGAGSTTFLGVISGGASFTKNGAGTLTLTGLNTYTAGTNVEAGRLSDANPHGKYVLSNGATLEFAPSGAASFAGSDVSGQGAFVKAGTGTLTLTSALGSLGSIQVENGTLKGSSQAFDRDVSSTGGFLQFDQTSDGTFSHNFSGSGTLLKTGSQVLSMLQAPSNTGGVRVSGGSLKVLSSGGFGGGLVVDSGASFFQSSPGVLTVDGRSENQGEVRTAAGATVDFTGPVSGTGLFAGVGTVEFDGGFSPGNSPATVTFQSNMALGSTNDLVMELGGTVPGTGYDHLNVHGSTVLGGQLTVAYYGGFVASAGQRFNLFDFGRESGRFSAIDLPALSEGLEWNMSDLYRTGTITVQAVPEPGSFLAVGGGVLSVLCRRRKG